MSHRTVVRIATAADPGRIETQNRNEAPATADTSAPTAPTLAVELV